MLMRANILAKATFLEQIPNLAYAFTAIDMWLTTFFAMPALDSSVSKGALPPPSTNKAKGAGGGNTGVVGKLQTHLITSFFHAMPKRSRPPDTLASLPSNNGVESTAASSLPSNLTKLAHQQNWASQAEPRSQCTPAADWWWCQQCRATPPPGWTAAEALPSLAGLHVQAQTTSSLSNTDGRHGVRDECEFHRPP